MPSNANSEDPGIESHIAYLNAGRRGTDRVVKIWEDAPNKQTIRENIDSALWDNCFLLALDEVMDCSVIIDHGQKVAEGLNLSKQKTHNFRNLPLSIRERIFSLSQICVKTRSPCHHSQDQNESKDIPVNRYRLALVPLLPANERDDGSTHPVVGVLGIFTYQ